LKVTAMRQSSLPRVFHYVCADHERGCAGAA
jgi:hypothetical protein